ncbi:MAG: hypothetical protein D6743_08195 [Calditrichaeota bacterium]|nr:MAG: hypothetical protein D6743_08195 [Calditrichota bacterium]
MTRKKLFVSTNPDRNLLLYERPFVNPTSFLLNDIGDLSLIITELYLIAFSRYYLLPDHLGRR